MSNDPTCDNVEPAELPSFFLVETALACDLKCPECAIGSGMITRDKGFMPFERFRIIADKIRPYAKCLYAFNWGEPLLNSDIFRIVRYASSFVPTCISTNGMSLTYEKAEELITSGVTEVIVSIDGVSQGTYEQYRVGGDVRKAFASLVMLATLNQKHGGKVNVSPQFVAFRHNQHEMEAFRSVCNSLGLEPVFKAPYIRKDTSRFNYTDIESLQRPHFTDSAAMKAAARNCHDARNVFTILLDGSVVSCCYDHAKATCFGNIFEQDVLDIWHSPEYLAFRRAILAGDAPDFCLESCMTWFYDGPKGGSSQRNAVFERLQALKNELGEQYADMGSIPPNDRNGIGWNDLKGMTPLRLYAGDIYDDAHDGWVGLSITRADRNHIPHDITQPFPLPDNSVDAFQAEDVFEHIAYDRLAPVIDEIYRVLRPNGLFRLSLPDYGCDVLLNRSIRDADGTIVFDPEGGGTPEQPGHLWFPRRENVETLLGKTRFALNGDIVFLHYWNRDGSFVTNRIDYSKGIVTRTPDFDERVQHPYRPLSLVVDLIKLR